MHSLHSHRFFFLLPVMIILLLTPGNSNLFSISPDGSSYREATVLDCPKPVSAQQSFRDLKL